jgi:hypothetical protein
LGPPPSCIGYLVRNGWEGNGLAETLGLLSAAFNACSAGSIAAL